VEILCSAAVLCLAVGNLWSLWSFNLPIAFVVVAVLYGGLRDVQSLNRLNRPITARYSMRNAHAEQTDRASR